MAYLIDTNVVSELRRPSPAPQVVAWHAAHAGAEAYLSALTIGEIRYGIEKLRRKDPPQAESLDRWLAGLLGAYGSRILPVTAQIAQEWGRLSVPLRPPVVDGLLAATARVHRLTLVTRNVADLADAGVTVVDPFAGQR